MAPTAGPRGRYAPSPTGELHLGNLSTALLAWLSVRSRGGTLVLRMEDLDRARAQAGAAERILEDLRWLGLDWDEGPDVGGPHAPYDQGLRMAQYESAWRTLRDADRLYPCFCTRKEIAAAASAPHDPEGERRYPGTCRDLAAAVARERIDAGRRHAWRFRVPAEARPAFVDRVHGPWRAADDMPPDDFVIRRSDGVVAYQLAVVVDDAAMQVDEVVRGDDLLSSTARQLLLFAALGAAPPAFGHVPLLRGPDGARLSKRHRGITLRELREAGLTAPAIVGRLAGLLGLRPGTDAVAPRELIDGFDLERLPPAPGGIVVDPKDWSGPVGAPGRDRGQNP